MLYLGLVATISLALASLTTVEYDIVVFHTTYLISIQAGSFINQHDAAMLNMNIVGRPWATVLHTHKL